MPIKDGDTVKVHYTGSLDNGTIFDTSKDREPLEFTAGKRMLVSGFENAIMGKEVGDTINVTFPADEGYGDSDPDMIFSVPLSELPDDITAEIGVHLQLNTEEGIMDVVISNLTEDTIELDANHPLAGKALTFEIEIVSID